MTNDNGKYKKIDILIVLKYKDKLLQQIILRPF